MKKKIKSLVKYYSFIIFPLLICGICIFISMFYNIFDIDINKIQILVSTSASFIGVLLTILTIYLAVPKNEAKTKRLKESYHEQIYLRNIIMGIILFLISIMSWIFCDNSYISALTFLAGIGNIIISVYYTFALIKFM